MTRRRKSSGFEALVDVLALLPWWGCLGLAVLSYVVLGHFATATPMAVVQPGQLGQAMTQSVWRAIAMVGHYLLPAACVVAAVMSAIGRRHRANLVSGVVRSSAPAALNGMTWREFEMLVGEAFRLQGFSVVETGSNGADGGVDLVLRRDREKFLVQCKQWKAFKVGVQVVRELFGVMAAEGATGGFVVTSGTFSAEAIAFADGRNVTLIDGGKLFALLKRARDARDVPLPPVVPPLARPPAAASESSSPKCAACARPMVRRTAKRGSNAGQAFWGCTGFPSCRETRSTA